MLPPFFFGCMEMETTMVAASGGGGNSGATSTASAPPSLSSNSNQQQQQQQQQQQENKKSSSSVDDTNISSMMVEGEEYLIPIRNDDADLSVTRQQIRRRQRRKQQQQQEGIVVDSSSIPTNHNTSNMPSLHDRLASSAMQGTLGLLRLASDVTMTTTGILVAPPLHATQQILLPTLYAALVDFLSSATSQRLKDWFKILQASLYHLFSVLKSTPAGEAFRQDVVQVAADVVHCVSSDASRQVIADAMACAVKLAEALHTPQMRALLDQLCVLSCRCIDAASSGRHKQLWQDVWETIWSGTAVLADPATTMALAEVTAHLCHALEMEDAAVHAKLQQQQQQNQKSRNAPQQQTRHSAQRRYRRNQHQAAAYVHPDVTLDPDSSVEDVLISSLGPAAAAAATSTATTAAATGTTARTRGEIPHQVTTSSTTATRWSSQDEDDDDEALDNEQEEVEVETYDGIAAKTREEVVDVAYLREGIQERFTALAAAAAAKTMTTPVQSTTTPARQNAVTTAGKETKDNDNDDSSLDDLEELGKIYPGKDSEKKETSGAGTTNDPAKDSNPTAATPSQQRAKPLVIVREEKGGGNDDDDKDHVPATAILMTNHEEKEPLVKEEPVAQFYRILDEILTEKRQSAIQTLLDQVAKAHDDNDNDDDDGKKKKEGRSWYPRAAAAAGAGNERGQATIRQQLSQLNSNASGSGGLSSQVGLGRRAASINNTKKKRNYRLLILGMIVVSLLSLGTLWFGLGCYGLYKLLYPNQQQHQHHHGGKKWTASPPSSPSSQEIVIRVIREVVHVNAADGSILHREPAAVPFPSAVEEEATAGNHHPNVDQIAECVASAL